MSADKGSGRLLPAGLDSPGDSFDFGHDALKGLRHDPPRNGDDAARIYCPVEFEVVTAIRSEKTRALSFPGVTHQIGHRRG
jgi:hypothetical protein